MEFSIARSRVSIFRLFGLMIALLIIFTGRSFRRGGVVDFAFELSGMCLLWTAVLGRLWALIYIAGNKGRELITVGPYSVMRHPLYLFSLIGAVGVGLASENLLVLACIILFYGLYYPLAIVVEERKLIDKFGDRYLDYSREVPAMIPRWSLYRAPECWEVKMPQFVRGVRDALWFIWILLALHGIEALQQWGIVPVLWKVP
ncbi:MAG: isoprenylcysteine carboxylmethyltransferase family protein [Sedimentisphaerales bacterium]|nr:isoprenylcysteine carboxylmethyltransferase family protein [Sedimentisphaerales bacterium]